MPQSEVKPKTNIRRCRQCVSHRRAFWWVLSCGIVASVLGSCAPARGHEVDPNDQSYRKLARGFLDECFEVLLSDDPEIVRELSAALACAGDVDRAVEIAERAGSALERNIRLRRIAVACGQNGAFRRAQQVIQQIRDQDTPVKQSPYAWLEVARALRQSDNSSHAAEALCSALDAADQVAPFTRVEFLREVALESMFCGKREIARRAMTVANQFLAKAADEQPGIQALEDEEIEVGWQDVVMTLAEIGDVDVATEMADRHFRLNKDDRLLIALVTALCKTGHVVEARNRSRSLPSGPNVTLALLSGIEAQFPIADKNMDVIRDIADQLAQNAHGLNDCFQRADILRRVATLQHRIGQQQKAKVIYCAGVASITSEFRKTDNAKRESLARMHLCRLAEAQQSAGFSSDAAETYGYAVGLLPKDPRRVQELAAVLVIASSQAKYHFYDDAERTMQRVSDDRMQDQLLGRLAVAQAKAAEVSLARSTLRRIHGESEKTTATLEVAETLLVSVGPDAARETIGSCLDTVRSPYIVRRIANVATRMGTNNTTEEWLKQLPPRSRAFGQLGMAEGFLERAKAPPLRQ